jgi:hydroxyacylglutathione hydrolase
MKTTIENGIPVIQPQELYEHAQGYKLIDVRRSDEFHGELGHIENASLVTLGPDLKAFLEKEDRKSKIIFICRSGGRSGTATALSRELGFTDTYNMSGGMLLWNELQLPTIK